MVQESWVLEAETQGKNSSARLYYSQDSPLVGTESICPKERIYLEYYSKMEAYFWWKCFSLGAQYFRPSQSL